MLEEAKEFLDLWVANNVHAEGYEQEGDRREAERLAAMCRSRGEDVGFSAETLDAAARDMIEGYDDLVDLMVSAIEEVNDEEVARQVAKD